jgi:hypothetical protein
MMTPSGQVVDLRIYIQEGRAEVGGKEGEDSRIGLVWGALH